MKTLLAVLLIALASVAAQAQETSLASDDAQENIPSNLKIALQGLQTSVETTIASKSGKSLSAELESLRIPDHASWFRTAFGKENGVKLDSLYPEVSAKTEAKLVEHFTSKASPGGKIIARAAFSGTEQEKSQYQRQFDSAVLRSLKKPTVFYLLQYKSTDEATGYLDFYSLGYLTPAGGSYGLVNDSMMLALPDMPVRRVRMGGAVASANLIKKVNPDYPDEARRQRISGTVRVHAIIGTNGTLKEFEVMSGDPILADAAVKALKKWRYRQTTLDGIPVEIDTTIDVIFGLNY